jgi:uncharacterized protein
MRRFPVTSYFVLAYSISWLLWAPLWLPAIGVHGLPKLPYHHALGAWGPLIAALLVSRVELGPAGPADLLQRMVLWRGQLAWVAIALLGPLALFALAVLGASLLTGGAASFEGFGRAREFPESSPLGFLFYNIVSFGYGEEVGWRGFVLPRLQAKHSALVSTLLLSIGWALWHAPLFFYRPGYTSMGVAGIVGWVFSLVTGAVLLTWLYNSSRGSLLAVALFHAAIDVVFTSEGASSVVVNAVGALVTLWGIGVLIVGGPAFLSKHGKVVHVTGHQPKIGVAAES